MTDFIAALPNQQKRSESLVLLVTGHSNCSYNTGDSGYIFYPFGYIPAELIPNLVVTKKKWKAK